MNAEPVTMSIGLTLLWLALSLLGLLGAALCAGGEMGVYSVNRIRLAVRAKRLGRDSADVLRDELEHTPRTLATLLVGYNLFSYASSLGMTSLLTASGYGEAMIIAVNVVIIAPVLFVVSDTLPKELFRAEADRLMYTMARPLRWLRLVLTWTLLLPITQICAKLLAGLLGGAGEEAIGGARERIAMLLKEGAQHGLISETQVSLLDRALALRETTVGDEAVPWARCTWFEESCSRARAIELAAAAGFSRYPVVDATGRVIGVVEHLALCVSDDRRPSELLRPVLELPEGLAVREGLIRMGEAGVSLAVVVANEPGKTRRAPIGIVTRKDLVEPLTGELTAF